MNLGTLNGDLGCLIVKFVYFALLNHFVAPKLVRRIWLSYSLALMLIASESLAGSMKIAQSSAKENPIEQ